MKPAKILELELLQKFKRLPQDRKVLVGPGDDAAVIKWRDKYIVFAGDMLIEDVHFSLKEASFFDIGYKAVARVLSDIAAMGGVPKYLGISLALPSSLRSKISELLKGIRRISHKFNLSLVGGDLGRSQKIFLDVWCIGRVDKEKFVLRKGAKHNDAIFLTGKVGGSLKRRHLRPIPRIREAQFLVKNFKINSMIDISDGLVFDLYRILMESKKKGLIFEDRIPLYKDARNLEDALYSGEDYELLFTASFKEKERLEEKGFYFIGVIEEAKEPELFLRRKNGVVEALKIKGYTCI